LLLHYINSKIIIKLSHIYKITSMLSKKLYMEYVYTILHKFSSILLFTENETTLTGNKFLNFTQEEC